jgi:hypothetical protein
MIIFQIRKLEKDYWVAGQHFRQQILYFTVEKISLKAIEKPDSEAY